MSKPARRPAVWLGVVLVVAGVGLVGWGVIRLVSVATAPSVSFTAPATVTRHLTKGSYAVFQLTGSGGTPLTREQVRITAGDGEPVRLTEPKPGTSETITRGSDQFHAVLYVTVPQDADYQLAVTSASGRVLVDRTVGTQVGRIFRLVALLLAGIALVVVGSIVAVVPAARTRR